MGSIIELTRQLRRDMTESELLLWQALRNRKLNGFKFTRQMPLFYQSPIPNKRAFFVADFYCAEKRLVVELDGEIHEFQKEYDANRDEILASLDMRTIRFRNSELKNLEEVKGRILDCLGER